jgi:glucose-1-phosphate thymidylyltransferase
VKVVIPLAGKGTRLRPHTYVTPKPLLDVGGQPVMSYILDELRVMGVEEIIFITGYLKEAVEGYVRRNYPEFRVRFVEQAVQNGTAGAVKLAHPFVEEDLLIIYVDTLFDADLGVIRDQPPDVAGILWVKEVEDYSRFGVVVTDKDGYMKRIVEKPKDPISKLANIGLYYIRDWQLFFQGVDHTLAGTKGPGDEYYITDAFQFMIDHGARLRTLPVSGWYDCGKVETLLSTNRHLLETGRGRRPAGGLNVVIHDPVRVADGVQLDHVELGPNVTIATGCVVRNSALRDVIIGERTTIEHCQLHDSIIGSDVRLHAVRGAVSLVDHSEILGDS